MIINLNLKKINNWNRHKLDNYIFWYKGIIVNNTFMSIMKYMINNININIKEYLNNINGQFCIVLYDKEKNSLIVVTDKISSVPIYFLLEKEKITIYNYIDLQSMAKKDISNDAFTQMQMSGYCIGNDTLSKKIKILNAGQYCVLKNNKFYLDYYFVYSPWLKNKKSEKVLTHEFESVIIDSIKDLIKVAKNKTIVVPLSDGYDSRLILSILRYLNYNNVICFSYGKNNSKIKKLTSFISKKLKYKYFYLSINYSDKKNFFKSRVYLDFVRTSNSISSIPSIQDIYEIYYINKNNLIPPNSIIVNGQTGDYISGGHIPLKLLNCNIKNQNIKSLEYFIDNNYSLWRNLLSKKENYLKVKNKLLLFLKSFSHDLKFFKYESSVYEFLEYYSRQSKYIMNQQIVYDYFGYNSYMPLWNDRMISFWSQVDDKNKSNQEFYKKFIKNKNYSDVWKNLKVNKKNINLKINIIRFIIKPFFIFSKNSWKLFDKRFFKYWIDDTCNYAIVNYFNIIFTKDNHRNYISWVGRKYLENLNIKYEK